jgi:hypothetical protein
MPRTKRPAVARAQDARSERQREAERELLTAPCRHHSKGAVCDQCVSRHGIDSLGFPTVIVAGAHGKSRGRYRLCAGCRKLRQIAEWNLWTDRCQVCVPPPAAAAPPGPPSVARLRQPGIELGQPGLELGDPGFERRDPLDVAGAAPGHV